MLFWIASAVASQELFAYPPKPGIAKNKNVIAGFILATQSTPPQTDAARVVKVRL